MPERAFRAGMIGSADQHNVAIIRHPDVRRMLLTMKAQIEAQRALTYTAAAALDYAGQHPDPDEWQQQQALVNFLDPDYLKAGTVSW